MSCLLWGFLVRGTIDAIAPASTDRTEDLAATDSLSGEGGQEIQEVSWLQRVRGAVLLVQTEATVTASHLTPFAVLIVDDNPIDQELAAIYIKTAWPFEHQVQIDFAADGREALARIRTKLYALVVLDWKLPMAGEGQVLRQLRQDGIQVPVVVLSGHAREDIAADLPALRAAYLNKNQMGPATFHQAIANALRLLGYAVLPEQFSIPKVPVPAAAPLSRVTVWR